MGAERGARLPDRRATESDRQLAVAALREGAGAGLLSLDELEARLPAVLRADRVSDLVTLTWDLRSPVPSPPAQRRPFWRRAWFSYHATVYVLTNGMLVGTWALTSHGIFWPFFPIMGWGIGLGVHGVVAATLDDSRSLPDPQMAVESGADTTRPSGAAPDALSAVRYVAVLFSDVANSTRLNETLGDSAWNKVRTRHLLRVRDCISSHMGTEVSTQGDGVFARFATPRSAVACAVEIQRRVRADQDETGFAPGVRIGVHAGEAIEEDADLVGNMVNLAARVTAEAAAGQILVTEPVADLAGPQFAFDDCGLRALKGISRPRHLLSVRW